MSEYSNSINPTIAAIATATGGGIGVVRVSGPEAERIGKTLCAPWPADLLSHHLYFGSVYPSPQVADPLSQSLWSAPPQDPKRMRGSEDPRSANQRSQVPFWAPPQDPKRMRGSEDQRPEREPGEAIAEPMATASQRIDQVMFCLMRAPRSFTGEDVLEIHGHGGALNLQAILAAALAAGAVQASPGEFSRRAFLAGRLDLTRAEAIASLIGAHSAQMLRQAQRQLGGELGKKIAEARRRTLAVLGEVEGSLDFPDLEEDARRGPVLAADVRALRDEVDGLARSYQQSGKALECGIEIALIGAANVGKSSLANSLCGSERVLVDATPGTTRDYVELRTEWDGIQVTIIDTAGERSDPSAVERQGLRLGRDRWRTADLLLLVIDGAQGMGRVEQQLLEEIPADLPRLSIWNKLDLIDCAAPDAAPELVRCSALCGWGLSEVRQKIMSRLLPGDSGAQDMVIVNARQADLLLQATGALHLAAEELRVEASLDRAAAELRRAASHLAQVTGEETSAEVLDAIFSRFCVGK